MKASVLDDLRSSSSLSTSLSDAHGVVSQPEASSQNATEGRGYGRAFPEGVDRVGKVPQAVPHRTTGDAAETPKGRAPNIQVLNDMAHLFGSVSKEYKGSDLPAPNGENHPLSPYRGRINRSVFPDAYIERVSGITERMKNRKQERPSLYGGEKPSLYE